MSKSHLIVALACSLAAAVGQGSPRIGGPKIVAPRIGGPAKEMGSTPRHPGVVSFTYRTAFAKDVPGTLDLIKSQGLRDIEFSSLFGQKPADLRKMLDARGLYCSSYGVSYEDLVNKTA